MPTKYRLKSLRIRDFLSHRDTEMSFRPGQRLLISGPSASGKSSIADAIEWSLYGSGRVENRNMVRRGAKSCEVSLTLTDGNPDPNLEQEVRIIRRASKNGQEVSVTMSTGEVSDEVPFVGVKGGDAWIQENVTGCSQALFRNSVFFPQSNPDAFVNQSPSKRKELLLEMAGKLDFDAALKSAREATKAAQAAHDTSEGEAAANEMRFRQVTEEIKALSSQDPQARMDHAKRRLAEVDAKIEANRDGKDLYDKAKRAFEEAASSESSCRAAVEENRRKVGAWESSAKSLEALIASTESAIAGDEAKAVPMEEFERQMKDNYEALSEQRSLKTLRDAAIHGHAERMRERSAVLARIEVKSAEEVSFCPAIQRPCAVVQEQKDKAVAELRETLGRLDDLASEEKRKADELDGRLSALVVPAYDSAAHSFQKALARRLEDSRRELDRAKAGLSSNQEMMADRLNILREAEAKLASAEASLKSAGDEFDKVKSGHAILSGLESEKADLTRDFSSASMDLNRLEYLFADQVKADAAARDARARAAVAKSKIDALELLKEALGQNGVRAMVVDMVAPMVEARANAVLATVSDFALRIDTQRRGSSGGEIEGLFLSVVDGSGEARDFASYSGGERLKVVVAITEALAELQRLDFRIMDEVFTALDQAQADDFARIMLKTMERYSQLLAITHLEEIKAMFPEKVEVRRVGGISEVQ